MADERCATQQPPASGAGSVKPSLAGKVAGWLLTVYVLGGVGAFPYFSWQYAKEHGFVSWLFLGELVPAGKALVWPYYAASPFLENGWTQEEKESLVHLQRGGMASGKAMILVEGAGKRGAPTPAEATRVIELLNEAVGESKLVRDDVLAKLHPEFPRMYREKYVGGLTRFLRVLEGALDGAREPDAQELATANRLLDEWQDWAEAHEKALRVPKD